MTKIDTKNWQWFKIGDLFEIKKGKRIVNERMIDGQTPCIRPIEDNNGVYKYIDIKPNHKKNTITVNYNGSVAEAFYQYYDYFALDDVNVLYPKFELNEKLALFFVTLIRREKYRFGYGRKWHLERMKESKIKLPAKKVSQPDYVEMEKIIEKSDSQKLLTRDLSKPYHQKQISLRDREWKWFEYQEVFDLEIGKSNDLNKMEVYSSEVNFVSRTEENNGVIAKVKKATSLKTYKPNCLTIPMVGNAMKSSFQSQEFCVSQNIAILRIKNFEMNGHIGNFLNTLLRKEVIRFSYGRTLSLEILKTTKIKLPVSSQNQPDWRFMEDYIKSLPYSANL